MKVYIHTNKGWTKIDNVLTPATWKIRKNTEYVPTKETISLTEKFIKEMPFVIVRRGYYIIQSVF